jgi:hypothetical protein
MPPQPTSNKQILNISAKEDPETLFELMEHIGTGRFNILNVAMAKYTKFIYLNKG